MVILDMNVFLVMEDAEGRSDDFWPWTLSRCFYFEDLSGTKACGGRVFSLDASSGLFWPRAGAFGASAILPPCAQLLWCELYAMRDIQRETKKSPNEQTRSELAKIRSKPCWARMDLIVFDLGFSSGELFDRNRCEPQKHVELPPLRLKKVPCSYGVSALGKFALFRYMSEFRLRVSSFSVEETRSRITSAYRAPLKVPCSY